MKTVQLALDNNVPRIMRVRLQLEFCIEHAAAGVEDDCANHRRA